MYATAMTMVQLSFVHVNCSVRVRRCGLLASDFYDAGTVE